MGASAQKYIPAYGFSLKCTRTGKRNRAVPQAPEMPGHFQSFPQPACQFQAYAHERLRQALCVWDRDSRKINLDPDKVYGSGIWIFWKTFKPGSLNFLDQALHFCIIDRNGINGPVTDLFEELQAFRQNHSRHKVGNRHLPCGDQDGTGGECCVPDRLRSAWVFPGQLAFPVDAGMVKVI